MKKLALLVLPLLLAGCENGPWDSGSFMESGPAEEEVVIDEPYLPSPMEVQEMQVDTSVTPKVYAVAATRATNRMLDETAELYENRGTTFLYINQPKKMTTDLPDGFFYAHKLTRDIIAGSNNYKIVNNPADADYVLDVQVANAGYVEDPVVQYSLVLYDSENNLINSWSEAVRQLKNDDRSWW